MNINKIHFSYFLVLALIINISVYSQTKNTFIDKRDGKTYKKVKIGYQVIRHLGYSEFRTNNLKPSKSP